jgi:ZIP family zinc transporter
MLQMIVFSAVAGICGTGLGGVFSAIMLKKPSENITCWMLSFAAGVMTSIVCFGLIPKAFQLTDMSVCVIGLILGIVIILILNRLVDKITKSKDDDLKIHHTPEELLHENQFIHNQRRLLRSGMLILMVIGLHNIPEGIAIGAGGSHDFHLGFLLAIMIALHNIPEGMAIAAPLLAGGVNRSRVIIFTALSGAPTLLGGIIGMLIGSISNLAIAVSLSAAGGAMLYVVFGEIIPQSIIMTKNRTASIVALFGVIVGMIVTQI